MLISADATIVHLSIKFHISNCLLFCIEIIYCNSVDFHCSVQIYYSIL